MGEGDTETLLTAGGQNRVGPLELIVPIVFYNSNLTSLYVRALSCPLITKIGIIKNCVYI